MGYQIGKNNYNGAPSITNDTYTARGDYWVELAIRAPATGTGTSGYSADVYLPDGTTRHRHDAGQNATGKAGAKLLIGCNNATTASTGFRGKVHMVAVWNRRLSDKEVKEAFSSDPTRSGRKYNEAVNDPETISYVPGKPLFTIGSDAYGSEVFGGGTCDDAKTIAASDFDMRNFPSSLVAGGKLDFVTPVDKYQQCHNNIIRFKAAATSSSGVLRVVSGADEIDRAQVRPGQYASLLVASNLLANASSTVRVECVEAGSGGLVFDSVQLGGTWAWKWGESYYDMGGGTQKTNVVVGTDAKTSWYRAFNNYQPLGSSLTFALPDDIAENFYYRLSFKVHSCNNGNTNLWMTVNDTLIVTNCAIVATKKKIRTADSIHSIPLAKNVLTGGDNVLFIKSVDENGGHYWDPEYWIIEPIRRKYLGGLSIFIW